MDRSSAAQDRWPDGSADECPKCGFLHAYDRSCEDRASSAASMYRIECDRAMRDYDALEVDVGIMAEALVKIAALRPNKAFDPWARAIAEEALAQLSDRVPQLRRVSAAGATCGQQPSSGTCFR